MTVIESKVTVAKYRDEFLRDIILPFEHAHSAENSIIVNDNATSHRARVVTVYKQANNIITEDWPARSPHLNVTEHALDILQRADNARQPAPNSLAELSVAVQEEWNNLDQKKS